MSSHAHARTSRYTVRKLHPALGAEVRGVDMRQPLDAAAFQELQDIWMEHLVLVFPGQHVSDAEHVAFTRYFGTSTLAGQFALAASFPVQGDIQAITNVDVELINAQGSTRTGKVGF